MNRAANLEGPGIDRERQRKLRAAIVRALKKYGPMTARGLAAHIHCAGKHTLTLCARQLMEAGRIVTRLQIDPEKIRATADLLWLMPDQQHRPLVPTYNGCPRRKPEGWDEPAVKEVAPLSLRPGVTPADMEWQAYWRLPRAERRSRPEPVPESGRGIAGWDGARTLDDLHQGGLSEGEARP